MHKRFFLFALVPATLASTARADHRFMFDFSDHFKVMKEMHEEMIEMHKQMATFFSQPESKKNKAVEVSVKENRQENTIDIVIHNVETKQDKPEASFHSDSVSKEMTVEIPLAYGTLSINNRYEPACAGWLITTILRQEQTQESGEQKTVTSSSSSKTIMTHCAPDFTTIPQITYDKETKTVTVNCATQIHSDQKTHTVIPVAIK